MFRCLYDFSYECDIQEALVFYFFYSIFIGYFIISSCFVLMDGRFTDDLANLVNYDYIAFAAFLVCLIPFVVCTTIAGFIVIKKSLGNPFSIFLVILTAFVTIISPNPSGFYIGLIPVSILMSMDDRSKIMKKELEDDIKQRGLLYRHLEKEMARDRVRELIFKLSKKSQNQEE